MTDLSSSSSRTLPQSERDVEHVPPSDTSRPARVGLWVLGLGFGGFLLFAALAPLDEGVPAHGMVTVDTKRKAVQHLNGGIVKQVWVKEGDLVQAGQILIELDTALARANYESVCQRYMGLRAMQGRLHAEKAGAAAIVFHQDLTAFEPDALAHMLTQQQLFQSRRAALTADVQAMEEAISGHQGMLRSYAAMLENRTYQLDLLDEELINTGELVAEGYAPRNRQLELERMSADARASIADLMGNVIRGQRTIAELKQRIVSRRQEFYKEADTQLIDVVRDVQSEYQKCLAVKADLERTGIKAPVTGQVVGLLTQTVGGVVQAGQKLMDIVPEAEPLLLEARIEPHLIDKVHAGLKTDLRFSTFTNSPQLVAEGEVISVSKDLLTEQQGTAVQSYYLARVKVTPAGEQVLGQHTLQPGMPAELVIKTGERSMLTYLLSPLTKRLAASMKE